jgi:WD40 repeat protein
MPTDDQTGPVRLPAAGLAVEAPRGAGGMTRGRMLAYVAVGIATLALATGVIARYSGTDDADAATSNVAPVASPQEATGEQALRGGVGPARQVTMSPRGDQILAVRERGVDLWKLDGSHTAWLAVDGDRVNGAVWSADGTRVVVWGPDGTVRLWNATTGAMVKTIQAGMGFVETVELADDTHVLVIGEDGVRRLWDLEHDTVQVDRSRKGTGSGARRTDDPSRGEAIDARSPDGQWRAFVDGRGDVRLQRVAI